MDYIPEIEITPHLLSGLNALTAEGWRVSVGGRYSNHMREEVGVTIRAGGLRNRHRFDYRHVRENVYKETHQKYWLGDNGKTTIDAILSEIKSLVGSKPAK